MRREIVRVRHVTRRHVDGSGVEPNKAVRIDPDDRVNARHEVAAVGDHRLEIDAGERAAPFQRLDHRGKGRVGGAEAARGVNFQRSGQSGGLAGGVFDRALVGRLRGRHIDDADRHPQQNDQTQQDPTQPGHIRYAAFRPGVGFGGSIGQTRLQDRSRNGTVDPVTCPGAG